MELPASIVQMPIPAVMKTLMAKSAILYQGDLCIHVDMLGILQETCAKSKRSKTCVDECIGNHGYGGAPELRHIDVVRATLEVCDITILEDEWNVVKRDLASIARRPQQEQKPAICDVVVSQADDEESVQQSRIQNQKRPLDNAVSEPSMKRSTSTSSSSASALSSRSATTGCRSTTSSVGEAALRSQNQALLRLLAEKDARIMDLTKSKKYLHQKLRRGNEQIARLEDDLKVAKQAKTLDIHRVNHIEDADESKRWSWLTPRGTLNLAIRRNLSNISTHDLGFVILDDASRWTVMRAELKASACFVASSRLFFERMHHDLFSVTNTGGFSVSFVASRQDATNGREKVACAEIEAAYADNMQASEIGGMTWQHFHHICRASDVLPIEDETGHGTIGFSLKAHNSIGCPTYVTFNEEPFANVADRMMGLD